MPKKTYRKQDDTDWGWLTTVPFPKKHTAQMIAFNLCEKYTEVVIDKGSSGYVVKYRGPKNG